MAAAQRQGYCWPNLCGGKAACSLCYIQVREGLEVLSPPTPREREALRLLRGVEVDQNPEIRLACQASIFGPVTIFKRGVRQEVAP